MTVDSGNIRFVRIFPGVPWTGGVKRQWGNQKRGSLGFRTLRLRYLRKWGRHYYIVSALSPFHRPQNTLYMTLIDHFTFNYQFSLLRTAFERLGYILSTCRRAIYRIFLVWRQQQTCAEADSESAIRRILPYCGSAKGLRIFRNENFRAGWGWAEFNAPPDTV